MLTRRILCIWVAFSFLGTSLTLPSAFSQSVTSELSGLSFRLPKPGTRVNLSPAFQPVLIKGLKIHPENPFKFDFIVDPGDEKLNAEDFQKTSQRLVNYFLASLAVPEKDLWVNLSPVEKNHIIPYALSKTELGRDLLAEDYMLKQLSASLIYPENGLGKSFWNKVYIEAYRKYGVTQVPVSLFNKVWILPQKASVFERGNTVYIVNAHLKVMLEDDYLAQRMLAKKVTQPTGNFPVKDISKQVLREIVVPALEKEVNEDRNFAPVRQVFYSLILAQWYQDVFKQSVLNKVYSGLNKVAGIDLSDPKNKDLIYRQYLAAYKKGVFNYIKEETDQSSQQPVPRKYFSGGFVGQHVTREAASAAGMAGALGSLKGVVDVSVNVAPMDQAMVSPAKWYDLNTPKDILAELKGLIKPDGTFKRQRLFALIDRYSDQVANQRFYPVQGAWPVLKAISLLSKDEEQDMVNALKNEYADLKERPELVDKILLMNSVLDRENWLKERTPHLVGRTIYLLAAEIHHWAGGLGPVMKFHGKGMHDLGADVKYVEARYQYSINGTVEKSRFREVVPAEPAVGDGLLHQLMENGLVNEVSLTDVKPNTEGTITKFQIEKKGVELNWNDVARKLIDNGWAVPISESELDISKDFEAHINRMTEVFGENFLKVFRTLKRSQNIITEKGVLKIAGDRSGKIWSILQHPLDYKDKNMGMKELTEDVDRFVVEMGDIHGRAIVVKQAFSEDASEQDAIWGDLLANGYIDHTGVIQLIKLGEAKEPSEMILPGLTDEQKEKVFAIMQHVRDGSIRQVWTVVSLGIDENDIPTYLFRDIQADGVSSYFTKMLYNYKGRENPVGKEESMAYINVASAQLLQRLETKRKKEQGNNWKPAVVHSNDGQYAPLQAVTMSRYGSDDVIKDIFFAFTTHTYRNRGSNYDVGWGINVFLKHMMGIKDRYINAFRQGDHIDHTSGGVRLANWAGAVSNRHRDDVSGLDPNSNLVAVTNGAVPKEMASKFREAFDDLKQAGKIPATADFERPTAQEDALAKIESKKRLNEARIQTANGDLVQVDLDKPLIGYDRRLVDEKAGRLRAFTNDNIWMLVKLGYNVLLMGNHQGTTESEALAAGLRKLEREIKLEKNSERAAQYPGSFQFVQSFTAEQKKIFLAADDVQIQDSDNHTGAAEFSEEDITANAGYQGGPTYREGVIVDQGIPVDWEHPGVGQTLVPQKDTPESWIDTVYKPLMALWNKDADHIDFYKNAALSPRLNRIQSYLITSAAYLREYETGLARREKNALMDSSTVQRIVRMLGTEQDTIKGILYDGRNEVEPFGFNIMGRPGTFYAKGKGLKSLLEEELKLEDEFGYDALLQYYTGGNVQAYAEKLFDETRASALLNESIKNIWEDQKQSLVEQQARTRQLLIGTVTGLEEQLPKTGVDAALIAPGGIKFDDIKVERQGRLTAELISDQALEDMLSKAQGLYGVIVGVVPIPNLLKFIQ